MRPVVSTIAAVMATGVLSLATHPAIADSTMFDYQVTANAGPYRDIPGTSVTFDAAAGATSYLWARNLATGNVTGLGAGDNIGNTFAIHCRRANGAALPGEQGAYSAANLVPPGERTVVPTLRWLFVAPATDRYTCVIAITSYSTIVARGRSVTMRIPAGAQLAKRSYPNARRWTLAKADQTTVVRGRTVTTLGYTFVPTVAGARRIAVTQDVALTTCKAGSSLCSGGSSANSGTTVRTWIEAQPQNASGTACGSAIRSPLTIRTISTAKHHITMANTLYLTKSQLGPCARIRVVLKVENLAGNPILIHGGTSTGNAATHGVAFEYV